MPDPIIPDHYRAMVVFQHPSGLPEDRFVNTLYFRGDGVGTFPAVADNLVNVLTAFYGGLAANTKRIADFIPSTHVATAELRVYALVEEPPREPEVRALDLGFGTTGTPMPAEVASCLSYVTTRKGPRGRGRIYIGPLTTSASDSIGGWARPSTQFMVTVRDRADNMLNTSENVTWVGLSKSDLQTYEVTGGYVDDAWDTQRRRGPDTTTRERFGSEVLPQP